ncbi:MAG: FAD-dependent oxidoreductase [Pseudomonadota bacterium]
MNTLDNQQSKSSSKKILVVGAGPAGTTAVGDLAKKGHEVSCWEASGEIGGRANSILVKDGDFEEEIDYGAVGAIGTPNRWPVIGSILNSIGKTFGGSVERVLKGDYAELFKLSERHGLQMINFKTGSCLFDRDGKPVTMNIKEAALLIKEVLDYARHLAKWNVPLSGPITQPHPDLCKPWTELVEEKGWHTLQQQVNFFLRGAGYQDQNENGETVEDKTAAVYVAQYMNPVALLSLVFSGISGWKDGAQEMWKREIQELEENGVELRIHHPLARIVRHEDKVEAYSSNGYCESFDAVVFCCNPKLLIQEDADGQRMLQDASAEEIEVFSKLRTVDLRTIIVKATELPDKNLTNQFSFIQDRIDGQPGHFFGWFKKNNPNVYAFYVNGSGISKEKIIETLERDVEGLGGKVEEHYGYKEWKNYFPHVDPEDMDFFPRVEQLQGKGNLYFADASLSFDDMRSTVDKVRSVTARIHRDITSEEKRGQSDTLVGALASILQNAPHLLPIILNDLATLQPHQLEAFHVRLVAPLPVGVKTIVEKAGHLAQQLSVFLPQAATALPKAVASALQQVAQVSVSPAERIASVASSISSTAINSAKSLAGAIPESISTTVSSMRTPLADIVQKAANALPQQITDTAHWGSEFTKFIAAYITQAKEQSSILSMQNNKPSDLSSDELLALDGEKLREIAGHQDVHIRKWDGSGTFDKMSLVEHVSERPTSRAAFIRVTGGSSRDTATVFEAVTEAQLLAAGKSISDIHLGSRIPKLKLGNNRTLKH